MNVIKKEKKLYIQAFREIRSYIIRNGLKPGDLLPTELEMCEMLGVSRNVLREAIKSMELMGMVQACAGRGTEVKEFSLDFVFRIRPPLDRRPAIMSPALKGGRMRKCMDAENLHRRMKKLMGQLQAIDQMIDKDVPCEDILIQINAVKGALHRVGQIVLEGHLQHCVRDGIEHGDADATIAAFAKAVEHFSRRS